MALADAAGMRRARTGGWRESPRSPSSVCLTWPRRPSPGSLTKQCGGSAMRIGVQAAMRRRSGPKARACRATRL